MSDRTDFAEQARELLEYLDQATDLGGPDDARADRLADELHNAFVAGQEAEAPTMDVLRGLFVIIHNDADNGATVREINAARAWLAAHGVVLT